MNSRVTEIMIYLRTHLSVSFHRSGVNCLHVRSVLVLHEQTCITAITDLVWTVVILNSIEASGPLSNCMILKVVYKNLFGGQKVPPLSPPLPTGLHLMGEV